MEKLEKYWKDKIKEVVRISKESGYEELNSEFWLHQPAVVSSLVIEIYKLKDLRKKEQLKLNLKEKKEDDS